MPMPPLTRGLAEATIAAWRDAGYVAADAARALNIPRPTFQHRLERARALLGVAKPVLTPAGSAPGLSLTKTTVQYAADGSVVQEWRRLAPEAEALEVIADRLCEAVEGKAPRLPKPPARVVEDLMLEVPLFDVHFGKYAWKAETGTDYDLATARKIVVGGVARLTAQSGPVGTALLVIGGDTLHADTRNNITERGGHALDVDTRQAKVWETLTDSITACVTLLATIAKRVHIVVIPGNHDWESSFHLGRLLAAFYRREKAVAVTHGPRSRQYVRHGCVLLGFAHGHLMKMESMATLMAEEAREDWAATTQRVWHQGHIHKAKGMHWLSLDGVHGVQVEHIESVSGADAWHHENGFVGMPRRLTGFLWSARWGLRSRLYVGAEEV